MARQKGLCMAVLALLASRGFVGEFDCIIEPSKSVDARAASEALRALEPDRAVSRQSQWSSSTSITHSADLCFQSDRYRQIHPPMMKMIDDSRRCDTRGLRAEVLAGNDRMLLLAGEGQMALARGLQARAD